MCTSTLASLAASAVRCRFSSYACELPSRAARAPDQESRCLYITASAQHGPPASRTHSIHSQVVAQHGQYYGDMFSSLNISLHLCRSPGTVLSLQGIEQSDSVPTLMKGIQDGGGGCGAGRLCICQTVTGNKIPQRMAGVGSNHGRNLQGWAQR